MITRTTAYTIDLDRPTVEDRWDAPLTYGDKSANIIQATLMRGAVAATLSNATVMLYGVLSDGTTAFRAGTVSGNVVTCELDYTFYAVPGKMDLLVQLSEGTTVTSTPLRITAHVKTGQTGELVSTGEQFSLAALQAIIAGCETATENAGNAADSIDNMTVAASPVSPGGAPTAAVSDFEGHKHVLFGIPSGIKGDTGASITGAAFEGDDIVFTKDDSTTVTLEDAVPTLTGPQGVQGVRGSKPWYGTGITGNSTTPTAYATGLAMVNDGDTYIYTGTDSANAGNEYVCTLGGDEATALWRFLRNSRGVPGAGTVSYVDGVSPDGDGDVALGAVRFGVDQTARSEADKAQARTNIGAASVAQGVPTGGTVGQVLEKIDGTDYNTRWAALTPKEIGALPDGAISSNLIINGGFNVNQRAVSGTVTLASGAYGHDRWKGGASGGQYTYATSKNVTTLTIASGKSIIQVVEGLNLKSGTVCLSWSGTAQGKIGAGSFGASGITGTATGGTNLSIEFSAGTVSNVQLSYGSVALPFVPRRYAEELRLCQRYRSESETRRTYALSVYDLYNGDISYPVEARLANPTITVLSGVAGTAGYVSEYSGSDWVDKAATIPFSTSKNASINCGAGPLTAGRVVLFRVVQDSEL